MRVCLVALIVGGIDPATGEPAGGEVCEGCDAGEAWKKLYGKEEE